MKKVFLLIILAVSILSCNNNDDEKEIVTDYKTVKVVITRTSNDLSLFHGGTILTVPLDLLNSKYDVDDFDQVLENEGKIMLAKLNEPLSKKQEFIIKQRNVNIQVIDTPQLSDGVNEETTDFNLTTKIEIIVNEELVKTQSFVFDIEASNQYLIQYSK